MKALVFGTIVTLLGSGAAIAEDASDGNALLSNCNTALRLIDTNKITPRDNTLAAGMCLGAVRNTSNTMALFNDRMETPLCWPKDGINNTQGVRIVVKFLKNHPEKLHLDETLLSVMAFRQAFSCN